MIDYVMIRTRVFWILSIFLIIGILILLNFSEDNVRISPSYQTSSMKELHLTHKNNNAVQWELSAAKAIIPEGEKEIFLKSLSLRINKSPQILLTSSTGTYKIEKGSVTLDNPVELSMEDKKFLTSSLTWNEKDELITTEAPITFRGKNFLIEGTGLTAHVKKQKVKVTKHVKATFYH